MININCKASKKHSDEKVGDDSRKGRKTTMTSCMQGGEHDIEV